MAWSLGLPPVEQDVRDAGACECVCSETVRGMVYVQGDFVCVTST